MNDRSELKLETNNLMRALNLPQGNMSKASDAVYELLEQSSVDAILRSINAKHKDIPESVKSVINETIENVEGLESLLVRANEINEKIRNFPKKILPNLLFRAEAEKKDLETLQNASSAIEKEQQEQIKLKKAIIAAFELKGLDEDAANTISLHDLVKAANEAITTNKLHRIAIGKNKFLKENETFLGVTKGFGGVTIDSLILTQAAIDREVRIQKALTCGTSEKCKCLACVRKTWEGTHEKLSLEITGYENYYNEASALKKDFGVIASKLSEEISKYIEEAREIELEEARRIASEKAEQERLAKLEAERLAAEEQEKERQREEEKRRADAAEAEALLDAANVVEVEAEAKEQEQATQVPEIPAIDDVAQPQQPIVQVIAETEEDKEKVKIYLEACEDYYQYLEKQILKEVRSYYADTKNGTTGKFREIQEQLQSVVIGAKDEICASTARMLISAYAYGKVNSQDIDKNSITANIKTDKQVKLEKTLSKLHVVGKLMGHLQEVGKNANQKRNAYYAELRLPETKKIFSEARDIGWRAFLKACGAVVAGIFGIVPGILLGISFFGKNATKANKYILNPGLADAEEFAKRPGPAAG
ncbi:MAG: hypothetical protein ABI597_00265 [Gammaproteobacteria bacterium]